MEEYLILLFPDGVACGKPKGPGDGAPMRCNNPRHARVWSSETKRTNYIYEYKDLDLRRATLRVEVVPAVKETE